MIFPYSINFFGFQHPFCGLIRPITVQYSFVQFDNFDFGSVISYKIHKIFCIADGVISIPQIMTCRIML